MPSEAFLCWACLSTDESSSSKNKCQVCSPRPVKKSKIARPWNTEPLRKLVSIRAATMTRLCLDQMKEEDTKETKALFGMSKSSPLPSPPDREIPNMAIVVPKLSTSTEVVPSISLTAAAGDWPTMDFSTFTDIGGKEIRHSSIIRIVLSTEKDSKRKHRRGRGKRCIKCCEAAWADAYFGEAMKEAESVEMKQIGQGALQQNCFNSQVIRRIESAEDCPTKTMRGLKLDTEKR